MILFLLFIHHRELIELHRIQMKRLRNTQVILHGISFKESLHCLLAYTQHKTHTVNFWGYLSLEASLSHACSLNIHFFFLLFTLYCDEWSCSKTRMEVQKGWARFLFQKNKWASQKNNFPPSPGNQVVPVAHVWFSLSMHCYHNKRKHDYKTVHQGRTQSFTWQAKEKENL